MKIFPAPLIKQWDAYTIANEPVSFIELMERAARACTKWIVENYPNTKDCLIICGLGNNGGDGLAIGRQLLNLGYRPRIILVKPPDRIFSIDNAINFESLRSLGTIDISIVENKTQLPSIFETPLIIDALFGSGLNKPVDGIFKSVIDKINKSKTEVVSIDIPSGLLCDGSSENYTSVNATHTLSFQQPKRSFFYAANAGKIGRWHILDIGLSPEFYNNTGTDNFLISREMVTQIFRPRSRFSHKGNYGHALIIAGGRGKTGAAILAAKACLRTGAGLLTTYLPQSSYSIMQASFPEAMVITDEAEDHISIFPEATTYNAVGIGPGIGTSETTAKALESFLRKEARSLVLDADALNILAQIIQKENNFILPPECILTPHPKEFDRLAGECSDEFERTQKQIAFSKKYNAYIVLKGANTCISTPRGECYFNITGNPGMATAGSGDVLTGILTGLLAQGYSPLHACITGVYMHGLAGDFASDEKGYNALIASDIIDYLGDAFKPFEWLSD